MNSLDPSQGSRSFDNQVILASIHQELNIMINEQLLNQSHLILHEIFIEGLTNVSTLTVVLH